MRGIKPINRDDRLSDIDYFHTVRDLAIDSPFHYLLFDEELSPVLQALTLDMILVIHPTDAPISQRVWCSGDVADFVRHKNELSLPTGVLPQLFRRTGTLMLVVPPLDCNNSREPGTWETVYRR